MTTQVQTVYLNGGDIGRKFSKTQTDTVAGEIKSTTGDLSLYECMLGANIERYMAEFAAGIGICWIRNTVSNEIKAVMINDIIGEMRYRDFKDDFTVEENDILEGYVDVA